MGINNNYAEISTGLFFCSSSFCTQTIKLSPPLLELDVKLEISHIYLYLYLLSWRRPGGAVGAITSPAWLNEGNWWDEWMGMEQVEGIFMEGRFMDIWVLIAMCGFWSTIDMEERGMLCRI